jgi:hypothetical protein
MVTGVNGRTIHHVPDPVVVVFDTELENVTIQGNIGALCTDYKRKTIGQRKFH